MYCTIFIMMIVNCEWVECFDYRRGGVMRGGGTRGRGRYMLYNILYLSFVLAWCGVETLHKCVITLIGSFFFFFLQEAEEAIWSFLLHISWNSAIYFAHLLPVSNSISALSYLHQLHQFKHFSTAPLPLGHCPTCSYLQTYRCWKTVCDFSCLFWGNIKKSMPIPHWYKV